MEEKRKIPRKHAEIATQYFNDSSIEVQYYNTDFEFWEVCEGMPRFHEDTKYRIKPTEPELIPYSFEDSDSLLGKFIQNKKQKTKSIITSVSENSVRCGPEHVSFDSLLKNWEYLGGGPLGKKV